MEIKEIIGDYGQFTKDLLRKTAKTGITLETYELDHLCYRTADLDEYHDMRTKLMRFSSEVATTTHNGRQFSIFKLAQPLAVDDWTIPLIELPAPAPDKPYGSGLEHIEVVIRQGFEAFCNRYKELFTHQPDIDTANPTASITFSDKTTIKFHSASLDETVVLQGDKFEPATR